MVPYIICFTISCSLFYLSDRVMKNQRFIVDTVALLAICILAGLRAAEIGTDTKAYLIPMIEGAQKASSFGKYLNYRWLQAYFYRSVSEIEPAFALLVYLITKLTNSIFWVQFSIELMVIMPIYMVLKKRKYIPTWFGMLVFLCLFFNTSLNAMRQAIAVSFVFLAVHSLQQRKWVKYVTYLIVAILFHKSALLGIAIGAIDLFLSNDEKHGIKLSGRRINKSQIRFGCLLCLCFLIIPLTGALIKLMQFIGLGGYAGYISGNIKLMPNQIIKHLPNIMLCVIGYKSIHQQYTKTQFYCVMILLVVVVSQYISVFIYSVRIVDYFLVFSVSSIPTLCTAQKKRRTYTVIMTAYLIFYWFFCFGYQNLAGTMPYRMM